MINIENEKENLLKSKEILEDEIKGLKKNIREMKRDLKGKEEKVKEIKIKVQKLEEQNDSTSDITEEENTISKEIIQKLVENTKKTSEDEETFEKQPREHSNKRKSYEENLNDESNKRRKTLEKFIVNISKEIETEREMNNDSQTKTEILVKLFEEVENIEEFAKGINELKKLKMYNYAESFLLRVEEEMKRGLSKDNRSVKTKIYQEMIEIGKLEEKDYGRLKRRTQRAIIFYNKIEGFGGRKIIKFFEIMKQKLFRKGNLESILWRTV